MGNFERGGPKSHGTVKAGARAWKWRSVLLLPLYGAALIAAGIGASLIHYTLTFPDPSALRTKNHAPLVRILAQDGSVLTERGRSDDFIPLALLPSHVINAVVATEDRRFYDHWGIDPLGMIRASFANLRAGRYVQGGSTLTQQLAKNLFLTPERTLSRKFEELLIALWLEVRLSKRDILELYLNRVYFGGGAYGIEAAALRYFDKSARALTIIEAAMIAGLLKAPSRYSPRANPGLARNRARSVLRKMYGAGLITKAQYVVAKQRSLRFANGRRGKRDTSLRYAIDYIMERLPKDITSQKSELIVETTINADLQRFAQKTVSNILSKEGRAAKARQAAVVVLDGRGQIRALVGGGSYKRSQFNRATIAKRQPGSAFKIFVYLAALEAGMTPDTIAHDMPININGWRPRNSSRNYRGAVSLRTALSYSINTVAAQLQQNVGAERVIQIARRLGVKSKLQNSPSLALGTSELTLLELTGAFGVFANGGAAIQPHVIRRIKTSGGRILYAQRAVMRERVVSRQNVGAMNDMLNAAIIAGTGRRAALRDHPAAGKTGTSQQFRDAWFIGYTSHLVAGVWVGNDNGKSMNAITGGKLPARIWRKIMTYAHNGRAITPLPGTRLQPKLRRPPPLKMPKEPIGEDFIARMISDRGLETEARGRTAELLRSQTNHASETGANSKSGATSSASWWNFSAASIRRALGLAPAKPDQPKAYMSLGNPVQQTSVE